MNDHEGPRSTGGTPSDADIAAAQRDVETSLHRHGLTLDDPGLWAEPDIGAGEELLAGGMDADTGSMRSVARWRWAAAAAVIVALVAVVSLMGRDRADWSVDFGPTEDFPFASATVDGWNEGSGTRMRLTMSGLEPAPNGFFYEMWMSEGPVHISAGTFVELTDVELRAAVARRDYPRLWVTLEPIDDDESPTTVVVIDTGA